MPPSEVSSEILGRETRPLLHGQITPVQARLTHAATPVQDPSLVQVRRLTQEHSGPRERARAGHRVGRQLG